MDSTLAQRLDRYDAWLDQAEAQIDAWFNAGISNGADPAAPIDHRALGSIVLTLRRVITLRQTLRDWAQRDQPPAATTPAVPSEQAMEACDRLLRFYRTNNQDPTDAPPHDDASPPADAPQAEVPEHDQVSDSDDNLNQGDAPAAATTTAPLGRGPLACARCQSTDKIFQNHSEACQHAATIPRPKAHEMSAWRRSPRTMRAPPRPRAEARDITPIAHLAPI